MGLTVIDILLDLRLNLALILARDRLRGESRAVDVTGRIHGPLKRIILPPKQVVAMATEALPISVGNKLSASQPATMVRLVIRSFTPQYSPPTPSL